MARWRAPVNHPTVMMRRSHVLAVGGYSGFVGIEDYFLWGKLLAAGRSLDNLPDVLVKMRAGAALGRRRGGWRYLRVEAALFRRFVQIGFLTPGQAASCRPRAASFVGLPTPVATPGPGRMTAARGRYLSVTNLATVA